MGKKVLLVRPSLNERDALALADLGLQSVTDPYLHIHSSDLIDGAKALLAKLPQASWLAVTSQHALESWAELVGLDALRQAVSQASDLRIAVIGSATANAVNELLADSKLAEPMLISDQANTQRLAKLIIDTGHIGTVVFPQGNLSLSVLDQELSPQGFEVASAVVYETEFVPNPPSAKALQAGEFSAVVLRSPSAVSAVAAFQPPNSTALVAAGKTTAAEILRCGLKVAAVSASTSPKDVAHAVLEVLKRAENHD